MVMLWRDGVNVISFNYIKADKIIEIKTKMGRYIEFSEENKYKSFLFR